MNTLINTPATMTSLEMVEFINSQRGDGESELRHDHFMAKVPKVLGDLAPKFSGTSFYVNGAGNKVARAIYNFPKREACLMAMSYSYGLQAKVFDKMTALEAQVSQPAFPNLADPADLRHLLLGYTERVLALQAQVGQIEVEKASLDAKLVVAAPKALALDRIATGSDGSFCLTDAAKALQSQPKRFFAKLQSLGWIHRRPMGSGWLAYQPRLAQGVLEHKVTTGEKSDGHEWTSTQVRVTAKGMVKLSELFTSEEGLL